MNAPVRAQTMCLIERAQAGDVSAAELLVEQNIPLVKSIVKRFLGRGCEYDDLYQLGCMGLYKAIQKFDPSMETQFSTYAVPLIMGEIRRHFRDDGAVKVSRSLKQLASRASHIMNEARTLLGEEPSVEALAAQLEVAVDELLLALDSLKSVASLDAPAGESEDALYTLLEGAAEATGGVELGDLIDRLDEREKQVILLRYFRSATQSEIAGRMGLSQAQVSRIENKALHRLKEFM